jgi:chromosome segregation ATPase
MSTRNQKKIHGAATRVKAQDQELQEHRDRIVELKEAIVILGNERAEAQAGWAAAVELVKVGVDHVGDLEARLADCQAQLVELRIQLATERAPK